MYRFWNGTRKFLFAAKIPWNCINPSECVDLHFQINTWIKLTSCSAKTEKERERSLSCVWLFVTPWTVAYQAPPSMGFSRQEYWSGLSFPSPGGLPNSGIEPMTPALQVNSLPRSHLRNRTSSRKWHIEPLPWALMTKVKLVSRILHGWEEHRNPSEVKKIFMHLS